LTHTGPKQLIKVAGKPVSQWALEDLREAGVRDVAVVLGNLAPERVVEHYGDGEPTLDSCIGREIAELKERLGVKVAVLTNASLLQLEEVKEDLAQADYVSVKVDAVDEGVWRRVNRPHPSLKLEEILEGALEFARSFRGALTSETMLVRGFNADPSELERIAGFLRELGPGKSYISIPVRPPAEPSAKPPTEREVVEAYSIFASVLGPEKVELLNTPEPPQFEASGDPAEWLLAVASVHPLRYSYAVKALEKRAEEPEKVIEELVRKGLLLKVPYMGEVFLIRNFRRP
jgi:wyosine [tRNA(Phe)-imidazoG37] synthetase (radical SAM superfamily)